MYNEQSAGTSGSLGTNNGDPFQWECSVHKHNMQLSNFPN